MGPVTGPVKTPLAVLLLDNQLYILIGIHQLLIFIEKLSPWPGFEPEYQADVLPIKLKGPGLISKDLHLCCLFILH